MYLYVLLLMQLYVMHLNPHEMQSTDRNFEKRKFSVIHILILRSFFRLDIQSYCKHVLFWKRVVIL